VLGPLGILLRGVMPAGKIEVGGSPGAGHRELENVRYIL
jgi:hypothetical protein